MGGFYQGRYSPDGAFPAPPQPHTYRKRAWGWGVQNGPTSPKGEGKYQAEPWSHIGTVTMDQSQHHRSPLGG